MTTDGLKVASLCEWFGSANQFQNNLPQSENEGVVRLMMTAFIVL
jgi:hypothetical protein